MSKTTSPALPLYGGDWLKSTASLPAAIRGYYVDLLIHSWDNDEPVPDGATEQMQWARCTSRREWASVWDRLVRRFYKVEGGWRNRRLETERAKLKKKRQVNSDNGRAGAGMRWQKHSDRDGESDGDTIANDVKNECPYISSSESSDPKNQGQKTAPTRELLSLFDECHKQRLGPPAHITPRKDAAILQGIWQTQGTERTQALIRAFFATEDAWVLERGFSVGIFKTQIPKLLVQSRKIEATTASEIAPDVMALCESAGLKRYDIFTYFVGATLNRRLDSVRLVVPNPDSRAWIEKHFLAPLTQAVGNTGLTLADRS